jgi:sporulation protein YtfJ
MDTTLEKIRQMVDSNTVIGNPIYTKDGATILPVSKVSFGFVSGGSDFVSGKAPKDLFGGGSGAGVTIQPLAFLVIQDGNVHTVQLEEFNSSLDRALTLVPEVIDKISGFVSKAKKKETGATGVDDTAEKETST